MLASYGVVLLKLEFALNRLPVLSRVVGVTLADAFRIADGDQFDEMCLPACHKALNLTY